MNSFNYQHLYYFYRVAQKGSVSEAAKSLHITQPALSMQIRQFEAQWGFPLFIRRNRRISLSEEGAFLYEYAKAIFSLGEEAAATLTGAGASAQPPALRIGVPAAVPKAITASLLQYVYKAYPGLRLVLKQDGIEALIEELKGYRLDLVMNDSAYPADAAEGIENYLAGSAPMVFCAVKALARKYPRMPRDLDGAPLILPTTPDQTYHAMQNYIHINKVRPAVVAEVQDLELVKFLVSSGKGIGLLNAYALKQFRDPSLAVLEDRSKYRIRDTIYLIKRQRKIPQPVVENVVENFRL